MGPKRQRQAHQHLKVCVVFPKSYLMTTISVCRALCYWRSLCPAPFILNTHCRLAKATLASLNLFWHFVFCFKKADWCFDPSHHLTLCTFISSIYQLTNELKSVLLIKLTLQHTLFLEMYSISIFSKTLNCQKGSKSMNPEKTLYSSPALYSLQF